MKKSGLLCTMLTGGLLLTGLTGCVTIRNEYPVAAATAPQPATTPVYVTAATPHTCQCANCGAGPMYSGYHPNYYGNSWQPAPQYQTYPGNSNATGNQGAAQWTAGNQSGSAQNTSNQAPAAKQTQDQIDNQTRVVYVPVTPPTVPAQNQNTTIQQNENDLARNVIDVAMYAIDAIRNSSDGEETQGSPTMPTGQTGMGGSQTTRPSSGNTTMGGSRQTNTGTAMGGSKGGVTGGTAMGGGYQGSGNSGNRETADEQTLPSHVSGRQSTVAGAGQTQSRSRPVFTESVPSSTTSGSGTRTVRDNNSKPTAETNRTSAQHSVEGGRSGSQVSVRQTGGYTGQQTATPSSTQHGTAGRNVTVSQGNTVSSGNSQISVSQKGKETANELETKSSSTPAQNLPSTPSKPASVQVNVPASNASSPGTGMSSTPTITAPATVVGNQTIPAQQTVDPN